MTKHPAGFVVAVIDDDQSILQSLEFLLESANYGVLLFTSAVELLDRGRLGAIDCIISDIDMPGMDGFELLELIARSHPNLPTILITGYPDRLERISSLGMSPPRVFTKPFKGNELLAAVGDALSSRNRINNSLR